MSTTNSKRSKQSSGSPESRAAHWYTAPSFVLSCRPIDLTSEQRQKLLEIVAAKKLPDDRAQEFFKHIGIAIGSYHAAAEYLKSMTTNKIRRRLKPLKDQSLKLLTDERSGISNPDEVTRLLLADALAKEGLSLVAVRNAVIALLNAASAALAEQKRLPNRGKDHALHTLAHRIAIIMRDVAGVEPTRSDTGRFAHLVRKTANLAGRKTVSRAAIFSAFDRLQRENVLHTTERSGTSDGKPTFKQVPVSDIRPAKVGTEPAGKPIYSYSVSVDGTITEHPVRYTKGGEPIYVTSAD